MRKDKKNKAKVPYNIPMVMACVLFCLTLFSTHFTSNLYARYTTSDEASDGARVIKFGNLTLTETGDFGDGGGSAVIAPGRDLQLNVTVSFSGSEADSFIFVKAYTPNWTRQGDNITFLAANGNVSWTVADNWKYLTSDGDSHVYYKKLESNDTLDAADVVAGDKVTVGTAITKSELAAMSGTKIDFTAYAIQANGFTKNNEKDNALDAWAALTN